MVYRWPEVKRQSRRRDDLVKPLSDLKCCASIVRKVTHASQDMPVDLALLVAVGTVTARVYAARKLQVLTMLAGTSRGRRGWGG